MQGFPEDFIIDKVSNVQAYKQFGNSVCVPVIAAVANEMKKHISQTKPAIKSDNKKSRKKDLVLI